MNRLCIYLTYNKENRIYPYMGHTLGAMKKCVSKLYVVCNYDSIKCGMEYVLPYADDIIYRENKGFDAGAYKDMLCDILGWDEVTKYDELILMNDSFFGPFFPMEPYFERMEAERCDFWAFVRAPGIILKTTQYGTYIQSYFLVFRRTALISSAFQNYWKQLDYPTTFTEAVRIFEVGLSDYMEHNKFRSSTFTDLWGMSFGKNVNPNYEHSLELIRDHRMPFFKKKNLLMRNPGLKNALQAVEYIEQQKLCPVEWIWPVMDEQFHADNDPLDGNSLERFVMKYRRIYIYGAGVGGKNLLLYFEHKGWKAEGLIVSDKSKQEVECIALEEAAIDAETGIIVSVIRPEVAEEIIEAIGNRCSREQMFLLSDCGRTRLPD